MTLESKIYPKAGVGALIVIPEKWQFLTLVELETNRPTNKLAGQRSIPMESVDYGNEDRRLAWKKLFKEEIKPVNFNPRKIDQMLLGQFELVPEIMVHMRAFLVFPTSEIGLGTHSSEVTDLKWLGFDEVLCEPRGSVRFRPGVRDVVETFCFKYLSNPDQFRPGICRYHELQNNIPQKVFDLIDQGFSVSKALSLSDCDPIPLINSLLVARSLSQQTSL